MFTFDCNRQGLNKRREQLGTHNCALESGMNSWGIQLCSWGHYWMNSWGIQLCSWGQYEQLGNTTLLFRTVWTVGEHNTVVLFRTVWTVREHSCALQDSMNSWDTQLCSAGQYEQLGNTIVLLRTVWTVGEHNYTLQDSMIMQLGNTIILFRTIWIVRKNNYTL